MNTAGNICFLFLIMQLFLSGCSRDIALRNVGASGRINYEDSFIFNDNLSANTTNILGNNLLQNKLQHDPEEFIRELEELCSLENDPKSIIAVAETSQIIAARMRNNPDAAVRYDLTTLIYTNKYFTGLLNIPEQNLFDPDVIVAVRCYNLALTQLFAYLKERDLHTSGTFELSAAGGQKLHFELPEINLPVAHDKILDYQLCADFRPVNLTHNSRRFGIGVPLICELAPNAIKETRLAEGQVIPATLAVKVSAPENNPVCQRWKIRLFYLDSRSNDTVTVNGFIIPLAQDFSTPLAYMVKNPPPFNFLQRTFQIELTRQEEGLYHLEPHNDDRIPVILVHGLMSDIRTWMQLINTLQSDPVLRKNYRFMGYSYSSGNPILISAMHFRNALASERDKLKRAGCDLTKFDRMILIGHSMGGLISRLAISTSDDDLIASFIGEELYKKSGERTDSEFRKFMIFSPFPSIKRVIFVAVPHRGSDLAENFIGKLGASMVKIPQSLIDFNVRILNNMLHLPEKDRKELTGKFNGIANLSPGGTAIKLINHLPIDPAVPYHSIIGNTEKPGIPGGSDGVVEYRSSHLDNAVSEIVVKSDHSVQRNPLAIQEIKRILKEHLNALENDKKN